MLNDEALKKLCAATGKEEMEMLEEATFDSVADAICVECGYTTVMEPDQDRGWCEECEKNTVKSCLILAGMI